MKLLPRSLFGRLVVVQVAAAALLAAALPLLISQLLISTTNSFVAHGLDRNAARLRGAVAYGPQGWTITKPLPSIFDSKTGFHNARVVDQSGRIWVDHGPRFAMPFADLPLQQADSHRLWNGVDVGAYPIQSNGHRAWLVISSDRKHPESLVANVTTDFLNRFLWTVPALILCTLILTLLFLRHGTRAIRRASLRADAIDGDRLDVRLDVAALPLEVQPLARAMNEALNRVQQSYAAQAEFAGNVAHELRTPLATIACRIEEIADPNLRRRMVSSVDHAVHVIDQLMMLARLGGEEPELGPVDLRAMSLEALEQAAPRVLANGRTLEFDDRTAGATVTVEGNESLARLSLDNLVDNAQRHTPEGTHIRVTLGPGPCLSVDDDGPGIRASERDLIAQRHHRGDRRSSDGAGLGLSIVTKAMEAQGGTLEVRDSARGAKLELKFAKHRVQKAVLVQEHIADELAAPVDRALAPAI